MAQATVRGPLMHSYLADALGEILETIRRDGWARPARRPSVIAPFTVYRILADTAALHALASRVPRLTLNRAAPSDLWYSLYRN
jgi:hypothetical protein